MKINENGRCCGRKPLHYKGGSWRSPLGAPMLFCTRCDREFDPETGEQRENWAWMIKDGEFVKRPTCNRDYKEARVQ